MSFFREIGDFFEDLGNRFRGENEDRRREEREIEFENEINEIETDEDELTKILKVDLRPKENSLNNKTDQFELVTRGKGTSIVRRGGVFEFEVQFSHPVDLKKKNVLKVYMNFGPKPLVSKGTQGVLEVTNKKLFDKNHEEWDHRIVEQTEDKAVIQISLPVDLPVGVWKIALDLRDRNDPSEASKRHSFRVEPLVYVLFNPWHKHDDVYMSDEDKRDEYILNDVGKIWVGGYPTANGREWVFGQFDDAVLPACVLLLEKSGVNPEQRGNPIVVSRAISKMVNSNEDGGVIVGRWDGKYETGTSPSAWTGSIKILEDYLRSGKQVKYGQCWVFSGVTTTVCRALGIPCRSVSNLNSAHDTNMSLTIDKYFDKSGNELKPHFRESPDGYNDSIWNFHVWNDVWMTRPDLPAGFGGWQAIDATPQERSHGLYQCGPASLEAIRQGQTNLPFDVNFVLAEVNADVIHWKEDETAAEGYTKLKSNKRHVGRELLTKKPGKNLFLIDREECTNDYKAKEGSKAERVTLHTAARKTRAARHAFRMPSIADEDVEFSIEDVERVPIGQDFAIEVKIRNIAEAKRTVRMVLSAASEYYTGVKAAIIKRGEGKFELDPNETQTLKLKVSHRDYYDKLVEYAMIKLTAIADVTETTQTWIDEDTFQILKPTIAFEAPEEGYVGKRIKLRMWFKNPLDIDLKNCSLVVDGPGLTRPKTIPIEDVEANSEMSYTLVVFPKKSGTRNFISTFTSEQLVGITGSTAIKISEK